MADLRQRLTDVVQNVSDESNHDLNKITVLWTMEEIAALAVDLN